MAGSLLDKIDQEFGTIEPVQEEEVTTSGNLLDKIDSEFGKPTQPIKSLPSPTGRTLPTQLDVSKVKPGVPKLTPSRAVRAIGEELKSNVKHTIAGMALVSGVFGETKTPSRAPELIQLAFPSNKNDLSFTKKEYLNIATDIVTGKIFKALKADPNFRVSSGFIENQIRSLTQVGTQVITAIAGGPVAAIPQMAALIAGSTYENLINQNVPQDRAAVAGLANAIMQSPMEAIGIGPLAKFLKGGKSPIKFLKFIGERVGVEGLTEYLQGIGPDKLTELWAKNPDKNVLSLWGKELTRWETHKQAGAEAGHAALSTFILGASGHGVRKLAQRKAQDITPQEETVYEAELEEKPTVVRKKIKGTVVPDNQPNIPSKQPKDKTVAELEKAKQRIEEVEESDAGNRQEEIQAAKDLANKLIEEKSNADEKIKPEEPQDTIKQDAVAETPRETDTSKTEPKKKEGKVRYKELSNIVGRNPDTGAIVPLGTVEGLTGKDKITEDIVAQIKEFHDRGTEQGLDVGIQDSEGNFVDRKDVANRLKISKARAAKKSKDYMGDVAQAESKERKAEKRIQKLGEAAQEFTPEQKGTVKKYQKLINKVANKRAGILEADELAQEANLALVEFVAEGKTGRFDPNGPMLKAINEAKGEGIATRGEIEGGAEIRRTQAGTQEGQLDIPEGGFDQADTDAQVLEEIRKKYNPDYETDPRPGVDFNNLSLEEKKMVHEATTKPNPPTPLKKTWEPPKRQFLVKRGKKQVWVDEKNLKPKEKKLDTRIIGGTDKKDVNPPPDPGIPVENLQKHYATEDMQTKERVVPEDVSSMQKSYKGSPKRLLDTANAMAKVQVAARKRAGKKATQRELRKTEADVLAGRTVATKERTKAQKKKAAPKKEPIVTYKKTTKNEKIATKQPVATKYKGKMYRGEIHPLIKLDIAEKTGDSLDVIEKNAEDGFVTENGRFVGRKEAAKIAKQADQLDEAPVAEIGLDTQDLKGSKTAIQIRKERKLKNPLGNQRGGQEVNLPSLRKPVGDAIKYIKEQGFESLKDKISVTAPWKRIGQKQIGESIKNFFAHRIIHEDRANDMLVKLVKNLKQTFPKIKRAELESQMRDVVLAAEDSKYWNRLPKEKQDKLRIPVTMIRSYFDNYVATLKKAGMDNIDFYHSTRSKLESIVQTPIDWADTKAVKKRTDAVKTLRKIRDLSYIHIPYKVWFPEDPKKLSKLPKANREGFTSLVGKKRRALSIAEILKKGYINKSDVDPVQIILDYGYAAGKDMALLNIRDEIVKSGLAVKRKSRPIKPKDPRDKIAALQTKKLGATPAKTKAIQKQIDKLESTLEADTKRYNTTVDTLWVKFPKDRKFRIFDEYWVDARVKEGIDNAFTIDNAPTKWDKIVAHTKLSQFYMPLFMPMYDVHQSLAMAGGIGNPTSWSKAQAKGWAMVMNHDPFVEKLMELGTFSQPFNTPASNFADQVKDIKSVSPTEGAIGFLKDQLNIFIDRAPGVFGDRSRTPLYNAIMNVSWNTAWTMDKMVRTGTALYLMEQGFTIEDAAEVAAKVHADYADVPANTRHKLNKFIFTPTFALSMGKVAASMVNNAAKTGMGFTPSSKVDQRLAWGMATAIGTLAGVSAFFQMGGYEPEEWGKKWVKTVNTSQGKKQIVVNLASPVNKILGYAYWLTALTKPGEINSMGNLLRRAQYQSTPVIRTALGLANNRKMNGERIYDTFDPSEFSKAWDVTKFVASELVGLLGTDMLSQYMGGSSERFSSEHPKVREQLNSDINFLLKVLNKMQMVSIYARQQPNVQMKAKMNNLNKTLIYEMRDKKLSGKEFDKKGWIENYKERMFELKKEKK